MRLVACLLLPGLLSSAFLGEGQPFYDKTHYSKIFEATRNYRLFLPADYSTSAERYPVIYYFHGHSDRYTLEHYDNGTDTVPRIAAFVANHKVIAVSVDGYVAEHYTGFYGGSPWDIRKDGGDYDFGEYFLELVDHIDQTYRTRTDRRHRATSGLSMGGFMSLYLSARYPDLIGSASAFNPGPEFYVGDKGRRVLWRPKDHVSSHEDRWVRLIRAGGDYISQYHEETREAYSRAHRVKFEYRRDEFHRHAATSIEETFDFHLRAFDDPTLNNLPAGWSYASPNSRFEIYDYTVEAPGNEKALVYLKDVSQGGLRLTTRQWAPDGPPLMSRKITVTTAPLYQPETEYSLLDLNLSTGTSTRTPILTTREGRIQFSVDGAGHQISFIGPGTGSQPPVLLPLTPLDRPYVLPGKEVNLPIRIYNPRGENMTEVDVRLASEYPTVEILQGSFEVQRIEPGTFVDLSDHFRVRCTSGSGYFAPTRLNLHMTFDGWYEASENIDVGVIPETLPKPVAIEILDGRSYRFNVFRQAGNQGGGASIPREVTEGRGNGNGILEPGEQATIWVRLAQGMDPFDKDNWYRCKVRSDSPWLTEVADIQEGKQREWTGAMNRTSVIGLSENTPPGAEIPLILENESWSYHYTPDVRFGRELLYQAFQLHTYHLHRYLLRVP